MIAFILISCCFPIETKQDYNRRSGIQKRKKFKQIKSSKPILNFSSAYQNLLISESPIIKEKSSYVSNLGTTKSKILKKGRIKDELRSRSAVTNQFIKDNLRLKSSVDKQLINKSQLVKEDLSTKSAINQFINKSQLIKDDQLVKKFHSIKEDPLIKEDLSAKEDLSTFSSFKSRL